MRKIGAIVVLVCVANVGTLTSLCNAQAELGVNPTDTSHSAAKALLEARDSSDRAIADKAKKAILFSAVSADLNSRNEARIKSAIEILKDQQIVNATMILHSYETFLIKSLLTGKHYDVAINLCDRGLEGDLSEPFMMGSITHCRLLTLLAEEKYEEALPLAKSWFNTCKLEETREAIRVITEILVNTKAKVDPTIIQRFKKQQSALSLAPENLEGPPLPLPKELGENILAGIKVDGKIYEGSLKSVSARKVTYNSLTAKGNLLLAADRSKEAHEAFQTAADLATDKQLASAISNIARAIRAEDSSIGRANGFIMSLRDNNTAAPSTQP